MAQDVILATNRLQLTINGDLKSSVTYIGIDSINPITEKIQQGMTVSNMLMGTPSFGAVRTQWQVEIVMRDGRREYFTLGNQTSHPTWANTQAGYEIAEAAIYNAFPS